MNLTFLLFAVGVVVEHVETPPPGLHFPPTSPSTHSTSKIANIVCCAFPNLHVHLPKCAYKGTKKIITLQIFREFFLRFFQVLK